MQAFDSVRSALSGFLQEKGLEWPAKAVVEAAKDPKHGDVATNLAMLLAKPLHRAPRDIAAELAAWITRTAWKTLRWRVPASAT